MANIKLITKLPRVFKKIKGLSAVVFNENGEELDTLDVTKKSFASNLTKKTACWDKTKPTSRSKSSTKMVSQQISKKPENNST